MVLLTLSDNELALVIEILVLVLPPPPPLPCSKGGGDRPKGSSRHPDTLSQRGVFKTPVRPLRYQGSEAVQTNT